MHRVESSGTLTTTTTTTTTTRTYGAPTTGGVPSSDNEPLSTSTSSVSTTESRTSAHSIAWVTPPPAQLEYNIPFSVTVKVVTEQGLPVPGEAVEAMLLAPAGSRTRLRKVTCLSPLVCGWGRGVEAGEVEYGGRDDLIAS